MKKTLILLIAISSYQIQSETYFIKITDDQKESYNVDSNYDQYGFYSNGQHRNGTNQDNEGYDINGIRPDLNSSINISLNQPLNSEQNFYIQQDPLEGNFYGFEGTISFNRDIITLENIDNKVAYLKSDNSNPYSNTLIKNGTIDNSISTSEFNITEDVYEIQSVEVWSDYVASGDVRNCIGCQTGNGSLSLTQTAATRPIGYVMRTESNSNTRSQSRVAEQNGYYGYYEYNGRLRFNYRIEYWHSTRSFRNENVLVGTNSIDYYEFSNSNVGDQIEIEKPIILEYSTDNINWNTVETTRIDTNQGVLNFNLSNLNSNQFYFRLTDSGDSQNITTLTNFQVNFNQSR